MPTGMERRTHLRQETALQALVSLLGSDHPCRILDLSAGGACIGLSVAAEKGEPALLKLPDFGDLRARVAWVDRDRLGLAFEETPEFVADFLIGLALYG